MVAGHPLPQALSEALRDGRWPAVVPDDRLKEVFGEAPYRSWTLYSLDEMEGETATWKSEQNPAYLGRGPDTLDPEHSILIGDLGVDRPFAVDLTSRPPVIRLLTFDGRWAVVTRTADELVHRLGLSARSLDEP